MLNHEKDYNEKIEKLTKEYVYNIGKSSEIGAKYIVDEIKNKIDEKKKGGNK